MGGQGPAVAVREMDHIVLVCHDVEATLAWYLDELGLGPVRVDEWRRREAPFPSARVSDGTIIDFIPGPPEQVGRAGRLDHLCLVVEPTDLAAIAASGRFEVVDGPDHRYGARGVGLSLYVKDPDGNTVELRHYG